MLLQRHCRLAIQRSSVNEGSLINNPLRILLLTAKLSPAAGGLAVSVPGLAHSIDALAGIQVDVMGTLDSAHPDSAQSWGPRVHAFSPQWPAALGRSREMAPALQQLSPDVIDVQGLWTWSSRVSLDQWKRHHRPYIITPRGMLDPWAVQNSAWKKKLFAAFVESKHLRHAHCLRATAEMEAQHFRDLGIKAPIAIVPNAITLPPLADRSPQPHRRILFLSRIHPKKGIDILLKAWKELELNFPEWELVIAGMDENGHEASMKKLAKELAISRVSFPGAVFGAEKEALYRSADLFVLPSHAENFGLVVVEALAQQVPVIATTNTPWAGLKEQGCGWWIDLDQARLTETMRGALSSPASDLDMMGQRGRAWIQRDFSTRQVAQAMREVYFWAAGHGSKPAVVDG